MKGIEQLRERLRKQWAQADTREQRLLHGVWPLRVPIGEPPASALQSDLDAVRRHIQAWRGVNIGSVEWQVRSYRQASGAIEVPAAWLLHTPSEWVAAMDDARIQATYGRLSQLAGSSADVFKPVLVRQLKMLEASSDADVRLACSLAPRLLRGAAAGLPLRAMPFAGADTKFWERNRGLLMMLLEALHPGEVRAVGLEAFLGAAPGTEHWLHLIDLDGGLLPWRHMRVRDHELRLRPPPGRRLLVVENLQCQHQLALDTPVPDTVAVLGCGLNLAWMDAPWVRERCVGYWSDLDTWGLFMLARARQHAPQLMALLMDEALFLAHAPAHAVPEPLSAGEQPPEGLTASEQALYKRLGSAERGRLEQEYVPPATVHAELRRFGATSPPSAA